MAVAPLGGGTTPHDGGRHRRRYRPALEWGPQRCHRCLVGLKTALRCFEARRPARRAKAALPASRRPQGQRCPSVRCDCQRPRERCNEWILGPLRHHKGLGGCQQACRLGWQKLYVYTGLHFMARFGISLAWFPPRNIIAVPWIASPAATACFSKALGWGLAAPAARAVVWLPVSTRRPLRLPHGPHFAADSTPHHLADGDSQHGAQCHASICLVHRLTDNQPAVNIAAGRAARSR